MATPQDDGKDETGLPEPQEEKPKAQLHSYWNFRSVVFQVENTLFSVLKHAFMEPETPFETMFSLPPEDPENVEGSSDDNPIILEGIAAADFAAFLHVLYPIGAPKVETSGDWMGVLRLSHKWNFTQIRKNAIEALTPLVSYMAENEKISMGSLFFVQQWFREGLVDVAVKRELEIEHLARSPLSLNQETIIKILYIRNKGFNCDLYYEGYGEYRCWPCGAHFSGDALMNPITHYCPTTYRENISKLVDEYFAQEINNTAFNV